MHTIKHRDCVAQQDNKTLEIFVNKPGHSGMKRSCHRCGEHFDEKYVDFLCPPCLKECGWEPDYPTNADYIRSMSDDELDEFIKKVKSRAHLSMSLGDRVAFEELCNLEWLKQSVGHNDIL